MAEEEQEPAPVTTEEEEPEAGPIDVSNAAHDKGEIDLENIERGVTGVGLGETMKRRGRKYAISWFNISLIYICPVFIFLLLGGGAFYVEYFGDDDTADDELTPTSAPFALGWDDVQVN